MGRALTFGAGASVHKALGCHEQTTVVIVQSKLSVRALC